MSDGRLDRFIYPEEMWLKYETPEEVGYSSTQLLKVQEYCEQIESAALLIVQNGAVLMAWGDVKRRFECRSIRKSYLSALYGVYLNKSELDLDKTLDDLDIDDEPPLTEAEKKAQVRDLLKSRSGVYHTAAYEGQPKKPTRGSHKPGTCWYYNNWDFNTLLTIFEQETETHFFEEFDRQIANPLQMEDFRLSDTCYLFQKDRSIHPAYLFRMSARDMARFGLLYVRQGQWQKQQILPRSWILESTTSYSGKGEDGYGYMWWVFDANSSSRYRRLYELGVYEASGNGGQKITIFPQADLVVVHLRNTYLSLDFDPTQFLTLLDMILDARVGKPVANPRLTPLQDPSQQFETVKLEIDALDKYVGDYKYKDGTVTCIRRQGPQLLLTTKPIYFPPTYLLPISDKTFIMEDLETVITFSLDSDQALIVEVISGEVYHCKKLEGS